MKAVSTEMILFIPFSLLSHSHCFFTFPFFQSNLPLLLKDAVSSGIRIQSYATFQQCLTNFKNKIKNEKKVENAPVKAQQHSQHVFKFIMNMD